MTLSYRYLNSSTDYREHLAYIKLFPQEFPEEKETLEDLRIWVAIFMCELRYNYYWDKYMPSEYPKFWDSRIPKTFKYPRMPLFGEIPFEEYLILGDHAEHLRRELKEMKELEVKIRELQRIFGEEVLKVTLLISDLAQLIGSYL